MGHHFGDEAQLVAFLGADVAAGQHHAHRPLERDHAAEALHAAGAGGQADARLGQGELGLVGGDDDVAGQRDLEAAAHGDAVHRGDHRLVEVEAVGEAAEALGRVDRALAGLGLDLGVVLEVVAGAEGLVAGAGDDGDPEVRVGLELVERLDHLLVRHGMAGVVDLGAVDRDNHQMAVGLDFAVLAHGDYSLFRECRFTVQSATVKSRTMLPICIVKWHSQCSDPQLPPCWGRSSRCRADSLGRRP